MEEIIKLFPTAYIRDYKGGKEIRTKNLGWSLDMVNKVIERRKLNVEVFETDVILGSISVREVQA